VKFLIDLDFDEEYFFCVCGMASVCLPAANALHCYYQTPPPLFDLTSLIPR
jgi:hypothetical protein